MKIFDHKKLALSVFLTCAFSTSASAEEPAEKIDTKSIVQQAVERGNEKLREEIDRVPGLTYEEISEVSKRIPGQVQIPNPYSENPTSRAVSVPGGLVSAECKHFARGFVAKRIMDANPGLSPEAALEHVTQHLASHRKQYEKIAGTTGLKRSDVAIHEADCPVCGPINAAEIACHKEAVKESPVRELIMFGYASDALREQYTPMLEHVAAILAEAPELKVALVGRASLPGGPVPNFKLSADRISAVWYGLTEAGVPAEKIVAIPIGEDEPHIDLQLAVEYGLGETFSDLGQKPLNQSVNLVVFRPNENTVPRYFDILEDEEDHGPSFTVTVTDGEGTLVLTEVTITANNGNDSETTSFVTDHDGIASLYGLTPGKWTLSFDRRDYDSVTRDIEIVAGQAGSEVVALNATIVAFEGKQADGESNESKRKALNEFLTGDTDISTSGTTRVVNAALDDSDPIEAATESITATIVEVTGEREDTDKTEPLMKRAQENDAEVDEEDVAVANETEEPLTARADAEEAPVQVVEIKPEETAKAAASEEPGADETIKVVAHETEAVALKREKLRLFMSGKIGLDELKNSSSASINTRIDAEK